MQLKIIKTLAEPANFWTKVVRTTGCWTWTASLDTSGYGLFRFKGKLYKAHRLSWIIHNGYLGNDVCILHKCDNRVCVNPDHLIQGTRQDNNLDRDLKGRHIPILGKNHGMAKLSEDNVRQIRSLSGTCSEIATQFGVSSTTVSRIKRGIAWKHLKTA